MESQWRGSQSRIQGVGSGPVAETAAVDRLREDGTSPLGLSDREGKTARGVSRMVVRRDNVIERAFHSEAGHWGPGRIFFRVRSVRTSALGLQDKQMTAGANPCIFNPALHKFSRKIALNITYNIHTAPVI